MSAKCRLQNVAKSLRPSFPQWKYQENKHRLTDKNNLAGILNSSQGFVATN